VLHRQQRWKLQELHEQQRGRKEGQRTDVEGAGTMAAMMGGAWPVVESDDSSSGPELPLAGMDLLPRTVKPSRSAAIGETAGGAIPERRSGEPNPGDPSPGGGSEALGHSGSEALDGAALGPMSEAVTSSRRPCRSRKRALRRAAALTTCTSAFCAILSCIVPSCDMQRPGREMCSKQLA
jgi:hypothetical protein